LLLTSKIFEDEDRVDETAALERGKRKEKRKRKMRYI